MSTEIQRALDLRVKYIRGQRDDVEVETVDDGHEHEHEHEHEHDDDGSQQSEKLPAVQSCWCRVFTGCLVLWYLLVLAGFISRYVLVTLEMEQIQTRYNTDYKQLQDEYLDMSVNISLLQDEVKTLRNNIEDGKLCLEGWMTFGSRYYFKSTEKKTWFESRRDCQNRGSDLVIINSGEEQELITKLSKNEEFWIGLRTERTSSEYKYVWRWVDGSPPTETYWANEEPDSTLWYYAACCDEQDKWKTFGYQDNKNLWICEAAGRPRLTEAGAPP